MKDHERRHYNHKYLLVYKPFIDPSFVLSVVILSIEGIHLPNIKFIVQDKLQKLISPRKDKGKLIKKKKKLLLILVITY